MIKIQGTVLEIIAHKMVTTNLGHPVLQLVYGYTVDAACQLMLEIHDVVVTSNQSSVTIHKRDEENVH